VNITGLKEGLQAVTFPPTVDVIISGPVPVLETLATQDVVVTVNVSGYGAGTYQLTPEVGTSIGNVQVESILPGTVEVVLSITGTVTPTPFPTRTPTQNP
jgi:hypothetical protein